MAELSLSLFGSPRLSGNGSGSVSPATFRHRLAVLALLVEAPAHTLSRGRLAGLLWPEVDESRARHRLNVALHELRRALGEATLRSDGDSVCLDTSRLGVDVIEFRTAIASGDFTRAAALHTAPFLDGFSLPDAAEFDRWMASSRESLESAYRGALEELARRADRGEDPFASLDWHRRLVESDPYNTRFVVNHMLALERAGDAPNALLIARRHEALLTAEMGATTDPVFQVVVDRLTRRPAGIDGPLEAGEPLGGARHEIKSEASGGSGVVLTATPDQGREAPSSTRVGWRILTGVGAAAAFFATWVVTRPSDKSMSAERVLVVPLENRTGDPALERLGWEVADWISRGAEGAVLPRVIDPLLAFSAAEGSAGLTPARISEVVHRTGANAIVTGSIDRGSDSLLYAIRVSDAKSGRVLATINHRAPFSTRPPAGINEVRAAVLGALAAQFDPRLDLVRAPEWSPPTYDAYQEFVVGTEAFLTGRYSEAADRFVAAATRDSAFTGAKVLAAHAMLMGARFQAADSITRALEPLRAHLAPTDRLGVDWLGATLRGDRLGAYRAAREAAKLAPHSRWTVTYGEEAIRFNQPLEALAALRRVDPEASWLSEWADYHRALGRALHLTGRFAEELRLVQRGRDQAADVIRQAIAEARPLAALGRVAEIHRLIDQTLALGKQPNLDPGSLMQRAADELIAHGYSEGGSGVLRRAIDYYRSKARDTTAQPVWLWALGNVLRSAGEIDSAKAAYRELARRGRVVRYRIAGFEGLMAAMAGRKGEAEAWLDSLAAPAPQLNVFDASVRVYYRARIAAQLGEPDRAISLLQEALAAGLPGNVPMDSIHIEPEFHRLRGHPAFDAMVRLDNAQSLVARTNSRPQ